MSMNAAPRSQVDGLAAGYGGFLVLRDLDARSARPGSP